MTDATSRRSLSSTAGWRTRSRLGSSERTPWAGVFDSQTPGKAAGGGITPCEEHIEQLVAKLNVRSGLGRNLVDKRERTLRSRLQGPPSFPNVLFDKAMNVAACLAKGGRAVKGLEGREAKAFRESFLGNTEALGKDSVFVGLVSVRSQAVDRISKEQCRGGVQGEGEEERLEVDDAVAGDSVDEVANVFAKRLLEMLVLRADELSSKQVPRVFPGSALLREDAVAEERREYGRPVAKSEIYMPSVHPKPT